MATDKANRIINVKILTNNNKTKILYRSISTTNNYGNSQSKISLNFIFIFW